MLFLLLGRNLGSRELEWNAVHVVSDRVCASLQSNEQIRRST